jgi:glycosyltransferase involved in cell wall biosynthesis
MKRVLLIAYAYPPCSEIGAVRPAGLAKYLPRFGWEPTVLTVRLPGVRPTWAPIVETGDEDVLQTWKARFGLEGRRSLHEQFGLPVAQKRDSRLMHTRILSALRYLVTFPDSTKGWIPFAMEALEEIRKTTSLDAILTTSPPISAHLIGRKAKQMFGCPWIADLRDLWSQNLAQGNDLARLLERPVERRTLRDADALVSVSEPWADRLRECYPDKPVFSITNGFDADEFRFEAEPLTPAFTISYTGRLYQGKRDPTPLFEAIQELIRDGEMGRESIRVRFYGSIEPWLPVLVRSFGLEDVVEIAGTVSRDEALRRQRESQVLLTLCWSDLRETGQHTGKVFEYLGAKRPILAVGGSRGVVSDLLEHTQSGVHARAKEELKATLREWYAEYRQSGELRYRGEERKINSYTHEQMAAQFADVLEGVGAGRVADECVAQV